MADTGRPTKYNDKMQETADQYCVSYEDFGDAVPSVCGLACILQVTEKTLYNWGEAHDMFLHTLERIQAIQKKVLVNKGLKNEFQPTIAKLMLANHGIHEKQEIEHSGIDKISVIIQPVDNADKT